jgi:hypothetical protein
VKSPVRVIGGYVGMRRYLDKQVPKDEQEAKALRLKKLMVEARLQNFKRANGIKI